MPRMDGRMEQGKLGGGKGFGFSGIRTEHLGATEYTLVTLVGDLSGTMCSFEAELFRCLKESVRACQKSPRAANLLLRVAMFSTRFPNGIEEIHGFKPLGDIDLQNDYPEMGAGGGTPLADACYSAIGATNAYGKKLADDDFGVNAIVIVITDGDENSSVATADMVRKEAEQAVSGEVLESLVSILVGINASQYAAELQAFQGGCGIDKYIDAGDVTRGKMARLADFISRSISSQSQALGSGGPSQNIDPMI